MKPQDTKTQTSIWTNKWWGSNCSTSTKVPKHVQAIHITNHRTTRTSTRIWSPQVFLLIEEIQPLASWTMCALGRSCWVFARQPWYTPLSRSGNSQFETSLKDLTFCQRQLWRSASTVSTLLTEPLVSQIWLSLYAVSLTTAQNGLQLPKKQNTTNTQKPAFPLLCPFALSRGKRRKKRQQQPKREPTPEKKKKTDALFQLVRMEPSKMATTAQSRRQFLSYRPKAWVPKAQATSWLVGFWTRGQC